jgi:Flp pilus assembly protein TadD
VVVRRELLRGLGRLNATTTVLQRARLADPSGGMWEAADQRSAFAQVDGFAIVDRVTRADRPAPDEWSQRRGLGASAGQYAKPS